MRLSIKNVMMLLFFVASLSSCHGTLHLHDVKVDTKPYVQLDNGERYSGEKVEQKMSTFKNHITVDEKTFKASEVSFYSDGTTLFANVGNPNFATLVCTSRIRLFKWEGLVTSFDPGFGGAHAKFSTSHSESLYIQERDGSPLLSIRYKNLKPLVMPNTPEYSMLRNYERNRRVNRIAGYSILGMIVAGLVSDADVPLYLMGSGLLLTFPWLIQKVSLKNKLYKTVYIADGLKPERY